MTAGHDHDRQSADVGRRPQAQPASSPRTPHLFSMTWRDGLFAHWPVDPESLRPHVPEPLELDIRDGNAWVSVLPFVLTRAGIRASPAVSRLSFPELNVRTYVRYAGDPGLFFFSIDVSNAFIARFLQRATRLPVYHAKGNVAGTGEGVAFSSSRLGDDHAVFSAAYRPDGEVYYAEPGSLERWLTARRRFYAPANGGVLTGEIGHAPWPLRPVSVTIDENTMFAANGLPEPTGEPVCQFCGSLEMTGSIVRRL
ncbi:YqjF family protein [Natrialbaceae archaeon AArc-T1-2]|uniref:YqjF family protein n=1 Tax=Natrialbaceae archaeon AArc-T1-2 TaxID=3053904 RepID=UPI00255A9428|nr:DUF2071 domain-containing protein [Natrialbaceae archaeon AArc-T1-2]WIV68545.1 DUF2071 domain-containing protein [Natrialbaceae archaeon AArc-T1-2]